MIAASIFLVLGVLGFIGSLEYVSENSKKWESMRITEKMYHNFWFMLYVCMIAFSSQYIWG